MTTVVVNVPAAAGLNATYTLQVPAGARVAPQVFNSTKSVGLVPASVIELSVMVEAPLFVRVMVEPAEVVPCRVVGKVMLVALNFIVGAAVPVPVRVTWWGEPAALSVTFSVAERAAAEAGLNPT
jgi:hypothetical protein